MKKWFTLVIAIFTCVVHADQPEKIETLSTKLILQNRQGYFALSDGSFWKVIGFEKRWRTPSEWWNNVLLIPKNYECLPNDWYVGAQVEVYSKYGNLDIEEGNASNQEVLKRCTHVLTNLYTGQVLFAVALHPAEGLLELFNDVHADGYNKGLMEGRSKGYENVAEAYDQGYADGYKLGCQTTYE